MENILVPIDGTKEYETGLEIAVMLALICNTQIHLELVIPTMNTLSAKQTPIGVMLPRATREVLNLLENDAQIYISEKKKEIESKGLKVTAEIQKGNPAIIISNIANEKQFNLIVIGTHGKAGLSAFWSGSIAAKITNKTKTAILFVPISQK